MHRPRTTSVCHGWSVYHPNQTLLTFQAEGRPRKPLNWFAGSHGLRNWTMRKSQIFVWTFSRCQLSFSMAIHQPCTHRMTFPIMTTLRGIENGSCLQITRQLSRHHQQVEKPLTYSFARMRNCELAMTPDQSIQGMRKKEIKYQRDLSKIGLWTILICEYGVFCKYIFIYIFNPPFVGHLI